MKTFFKDTGGSVAVYTAVFSVVAIGAGALALDIGRMATLRVEMQQIADAAALVAADQLDGLPDAANRAEQVAINTAVRMDSAFDSASVGVEVSAVNFYYLPSDSFDDQGNPNDPNYDPYNRSNWVALPNALTDESESGQATIAEVVLSPRPINFYLSPVYALFSGSALENSEVNANAAAIAEDFICKAPPLFACWYNSSTPGYSSANDILNPDNIGKLMVMREMAQQGGTFELTSGNFGFLDPLEGNGANAVADQLENPETAGCYGTTVTTKPGIMQVPAAKAIDTRFDRNEAGQAPNVINFRDGSGLDLGQANILGPKWTSDAYDAGSIPTTVPRLLNDTDMATDQSFWGTRHEAELGGGLTAPSGLTNVRTRYQMYLYELGITFSSNADGETWVGDGSFGDMEQPTDGTWVEVDPPHSAVYSKPSAAELALLALYNQSVNGQPVTFNGDRRFDGEPQAAGKGNSYTRRLLDVLVLDCSDGSVRGRSSGHRPRGYLELFITRDAIPGNANNAGTGNGGGADPLSFVGEIVRMKNAGNSTNVFDRVRLIN